MKKDPRRRKPAVFYHIFNLDIIISREEKKKQNKSPAPRGERENSNTRGKKALATCAPRFSRA